MKLLDVQSNHSVAVDQMHMAGIHRLAAGDMMGTADTGHPGCAAGRDWYLGILLQAAISAFSCLQPNYSS